MSFFCLYHESPIGLLQLKATDTHLYRISFTESRKHKEEKNSLLEDVSEQLNLYFSGELQAFDLPWILEVSDFQNTVLRAVAKIPFGKTKSYKEIAEIAGDAKSVRAVGMANKNNPIPIIIPCHRVIGADGNLTGYAGGIWRKERLLQHEGVLLI